MNSHNLHGPFVRRSKGRESRARTEKKSITLNSSALRKFRASTARISCSVREKHMTVRRVARGQVQSLRASTQTANSSQGKSGGKRVLLAACLKGKSVLRTERSFPS